MMMKFIFLYVPAHLLQSQRELRGNGILLFVFLIFYYQTITPLLRCYYQTVMDSATKISNIYRRLRLKHVLLILRDGSEFN